MKSTKKLLILSLTLMFLKTSAFALDNQTIKSLPSSSVLLNRYYSGNSSTIPFELSEKLKEKNLQPEIASLVFQVKKNNFENAVLLLKAKINPNQNYQAEYPLHIACKQNILPNFVLLY